MAHVAGAARRPVIDGPDGRRLGPSFVFLSVLFRLIVVFIDASASLRTTCSSKGQCLEETSDSQVGGSARRQIAPCALDPALPGLRPRQAGAGARQKQVLARPTLILKPPDVGEFFNICPHQPNVDSEAPGFAKQTDMTHVIQ